MTRDAARLLDELGLAMAPDGVELIDARRAQGYIHHSRMPVALVGYALTAPDLAHEYFPKYTFVQLLQGVSRLDSVECESLAALCGVKEERNWNQRHPKEFGRQLWHVIDRYDLHAFFQRVEKPYGDAGEHFYMRPRGFAWPAHDEIPADLKQWQKDYRAASPLRQVMAATVVYLYNDMAHKYWMVRVKKDWHPADAVEILRAECALEDWGRLYTLYSGW